jgi:hypothetical protein
MNLDATFQFDVNQFVAAQDEILTKLAGHMEEVANVTLEYAKSPPPQGSPYKTGLNRRSLTMDWYAGKKRGTQAESGFSTASETTVGNPGPGGYGFRIYGQSGYSGWLELGTDKMPPRPYFVPSFHRAVSEISRRLEGMV